MLPRKAYENPMPGKLVLSSYKQTEHLLAGPMKQSGHGIHFLKVKLQIQCVIQCNYPRQKWFDL